MIRRLALLLVLLVAFALSVPYVIGSPAETGGAAVDGPLFLPLLFGAGAPPVEPSDAPARIFAPHFSGEVRYAQTAIQWFGQVTPTDNYTDIRVGYNNNELNINLSVVDRLLIYNDAPTAATLTQWDSASIYLLVSSPGAPAERIYRFDAQASSWETARDAFETVYTYSGSGWTPVSIPFTSSAAWWGNAFNDQTEDRGWGLRSHIPFRNIGLTTPPAPGTTWKLGVTVQDRDSGALNAAVQQSAWPEGMDPLDTDTWGSLTFGLPVYNPPPSQPGGRVEIRHGLNGSVVVDGMVGGDTICGDGMDFWVEWGLRNYAGRDQVNIQNQANTEDWPCFSKFYLSFPLDRIPAGKVIRSASLKLYHFGNANPALAERSLIQVLLTEGGFNETTLSWNNAPAAVENVSQTWVNPLPDEDPDWPGVEITWDLSYALSQVYPGSDFLHLVLYSADAPLHSGKYFSSSDMGEWNIAARPALVVEWGEPE